MRILLNIFSTDWLKGHGFSPLWTPGMVWLRIVADSLIAISFLAISLTLALLSRKRRNIAVGRILFFFGIFILTRGLAHLIDVWAIWNSLHWLEGAMKVITCGITIFAALILFRSIPKAITMPTADELERKNSKLESQAADLIERDSKIENASKSLRLFR